MKTHIRQNNKLNNCFQIQCKTALAIKTTLYGFKTNILNLYELGRILGVLNISQSLQAMTVNSLLNLTVLLVDVI